MSSLDTLWSGMPIGGKSDTASVAHCTVAVKCSVSITRPVRAVRDDDNLVGLSVGVAEDRLIFR